MVEVVVERTVCSVVPEDLSVGGAHRIVQDHMNCVRDLCARKAAAVRVLVQAGQYVLVDVSGR